MLKEERQAIILREVNIHNKVLLGDLSVRLAVSEDTVRRDLQELARQDKLIKVRGGALSRSFHAYTYHANNIYAYPQKVAIAQKAVQLIHDDMLVLISGGSTNTEIARILPPKLKATFVTPSLSVAMQLLEHSNIKTIFLGGQLSPTAKITVGAPVIEQLQFIRPDLCLMGANSIDLENGLTDSDWEVVVIKKAMLKTARRKVVLAISEKLGSVQKFNICGLQALDLLVTELPPDDPAVQPYSKSGLQTL